jgi:microcystin-dependent protein
MAQILPILGSLTGGSPADLDGLFVNGNTGFDALSTGDSVITCINTGMYFYRFDATSGETEALPEIIKPDWESDGVAYTGNGRWILQKINTPLDHSRAGERSWFAGPKAKLPANSLLCDGTSYLRVDYPELFAIIGTMYGAVDSTHFNVPKDNGYVIRAVDDGEGVDPDAASRTDRGDGTTGDTVGTKQPDAFKSHRHDLRVSNATGTGNSASRGTSSVDAILSSAIALTGDDETRMKNVGYWPIIFI